MAKSILSNLHHAEGSRKRTRRIGRGQGSARGGTSTRGHKGEGARAGTHDRPWFEGGQMPLIRRVPKFGFHSPFRKEYQVVNVADLEKALTGGKIDGAAVTPENLLASGLTCRKRMPVKILGNGELTKPCTISAHAFSASAVKKIEAAGGKTTVINSAGA